MTDRELPPSAAQRKARFIAAIAELADVLFGSEAEPAAATYTSESLPPGAVSWRQILDLHRAGKLRAVRVGRRLVVSSDAWSAYMATCQATPRRTRPKGADPLARFPRRVSP